MVRHASAPVRDSLLRHHNGRGPAPTAPGSLRRLTARDRRARRAPSRRSRAGRFDARSGPSAARPASPGSAPGLGRRWLVASFLGQAGVRRPPRQRAASAPWLGRDGSPRRRSGGRGGGEDEGRVQGARRGQGAEKTIADRAIFVPVEEAQLSHRARFPVPDDGRGSSGDPSSPGPLPGASCPRHPPAAARRPCPGQRARRGGGAGSDVSRAEPCPQPRPGWRVVCGRRVAWPTRMCRRRSPYCS